MLFSEEDITLTIDWHEATKRVVTNMIKPIEVRKGFDIRRNPNKSILICEHYDIFIFQNHNTWFYEQICLFL